MKELILRTLTGIALIILVAGSMLLGPVPFLGILIIVYSLGYIELFRLYRWKVWPGLLMGVSAGILLPLSYAILHYQWGPVWLVLPALWWGIGYLWSGTPVSSVLIILWLALPLTAFYNLGWMGETQSFNHLLPLAVIALVWINDTFAYLVGTLLGKHQLTPRLSPGKTWEGFTGGSLFTIIGGWLFHRATGDHSATVWMIISLVISTLGLAGDLFESGIKRKMNVKNMGGLLPGHGGVLDRFDSLLFVAPAMWIIMVILNYNQ